MTQAPQAKLQTSADIKRLLISDVFKGIFIVNTITRKTDKNGKTYWEILVSDRQGNLQAKIWSDAAWWDRSTVELEAKPDILSEASIEGIKGKAVGVTGKVTDYRGQLQYNFNAISLLNQEKFSPTMYMPHSDIPLPVLTQRLDALIGSRREEVRDFLRFVFSGETGKAFRDAPAAVMNHHAYAHGLLEHTLTVAEAARAIAEVYRDVYPSLDVDIVVAGALLHDLGKIDAYSMTPTPEITLPGAVLDHIALGFTRFEKLAEEAKLSRELRLHLGHIMLSHHGQKEFGSPILPATQEALIVAGSDELDFRLFCWKDATKDMPPGQEMSAYHYAAQRRFWRTVSPESANGDGGGE